MFMSIFYFFLLVGWMDPFSPAARHGERPRAKGAHVGRVQIFKNVSQRSPLMTCNTFSDFEKKVNFGKIRRKFHQFAQNWKFSKIWSRWNLAGFGKHFFLHLANFGKLWQTIFVWRALERSALCKSRRELSNDYLVGNSASIQPRTRPAKFSRSPCTAANVPVSWSKYGKMSGSIKRVINY